MAASGERDDRNRALRIVSKCSSVDEFVSIFRRFCDEKSLFIVTKRPKSLGVKPQFTITLADGKPMLKGVGTVVESYPDRHNSFGRPGMKLRFDDLDSDSQEILRRLNQARKSKKNTPPPLPRHMRPKSEGEPVPPASAALRGLGDADSLDEADATQVDAEPLAESASSGAKEERRKGSEFVLPANPFGELTEASLEAFVECTLYEETGTIDFGSGDFAGEQREDDEEDSTTVDAEPGADRGPDSTASGAAEQAGEISDAAPSPMTSRPITVPVTIPPMKDGGEDRREPKPADSPLARSLAAAASRAKEAAGAPSTPARDEGAQSAPPPLVAAGAPATGDPAAVPGQPTPMPGQRADLTPMPQAVAGGRMPEITEPVSLDALPRRSWGLWHLAAAAAITLILGLVIGYAIWGSGNGSHSEADGRAGRTTASDEGRAPPDAAAAATKQLTAGDESTARAVPADAGAAEADAEHDDVVATSRPDAGTGEGASEGTDESAPLIDSDVCQIEVTSEPDEALVAAGGTRLGKTPYVGEVPCDADSVKLAHPRYANLSREIAPVPGERITLEVKLERPAFKLRVVSSPKGATVFVGGRRVGTTPVTAQVRGFERTTVKVSKRGYKAYSRQIYPKQALTTITTALKKSSTRKRSTKRKSTR